MMDYAKIFDLLRKGLMVVKAIMDAAEDASPAIRALIDLVNGAASGEITDEQMAAVEAQLDKLIEEFNAPLPEVEL
jgi:hypothetical protein